jgi:hypothetical protein
MYLKKKEGDWSIARQKQEGELSQRNSPQKHSSLDK